MAKDIDALREMFQSGEYVPFDLKSALLIYPHLHEPDTAFDKVGKYKVCCVIPDDVAKDMEAIGFTVKEDKDGQKYVDAKRNPSIGPPRVTKDGAPFDARKIGNGTIATVKVKAKYMKVTGKYYLPIYIEEVVIEDLVEYTGSGGGTSSPVELM